MRTTRPPIRSTTARASSTQRGSGHCFAGLAVRGWRVTTERAEARARAADTRAATAGSSSGSRGNGAVPVPPAISHPRSVSWRPDSSSSAGPSVR